MKKIIACQLALCTLLISGSCFSQNPFITSIYTADPSAHVWADGRLYVYPSHDIDPARGCDLMDRYHVYSTDDMVTWRDEGEILNASQVAWGRKEGGFMWAPDCAYKNGTYYYYFPHPSDTKWNNSWKIGVATSKKPASDFTSAGYIKGLDSSSMIDPCVFIDTDGQAYFYYGGGSKCSGGKLKDNMIEIDGTLQKMEGLVDFHEATWVFKRNGIYYLTYADNHGRENQLRYATSNGPLGPWKYQGVFLGSTDCDTNHGSVVEYKGKWYIFYHNQQLSNTGQGNLRSICVDYVQFNEDGTIKLVEQTKTGPSAIAALPGVKKSIRYEAEKADVSGGATLTGNYVTNLKEASSAITFPRVNGGKKGGRATITIAHANVAYGRIRLVVNGVDLSFLNAMSTADATTFTGKAMFTVKLKAGDNTIRLEGGGKELINVDYITITPLD
ncbi:MULTISPECIES: family 43 glycosylhydrolase [Niastella]|uniref:Family 43 glycosylhydrolase n=1 Tax=Niastella soli TaxID=2821487 RepID=A0ABS3Z2T0_9BACT|nr:family 43 glycosylhydrolase [Niastella soli]MBO9204473.1 family 43 glycosylhydrolase [Niastella soli]